MEDISEHRRRDKLSKTIAALGRVIALREQRTLSEAERAGLVQFYSLAWDLAWKVLRDDVIRSGVTLQYIAPNTVIRGANSAHIIDDGDAWVLAGRARNILAHSYDDELVDKIIAEIVRQHFPLFKSYSDTLGAGDEPR